MSHALRGFEYLPPWPNYFGGRGGGGGGGLKLTVLFLTSADERESRPPERGGGGGGGGGGGAGGRVFEFMCISPFYKFLLVARMVCLSVTSRLVTTVTPIIFHQCFDDAICLLCLSDPKLELLLVAGVR